MWRARDRREPNVRSKANLLPILLNPIEPSFWLILNVSVTPFGNRHGGMYYNCEAVEFLWQISYYGGCSDIKGYRLHEGLRYFREISVDDVTLPSLPDPPLTQLNIT